MIIELDGVELEVGKDIVFLTTPESTEDGWKYKMKAMSDKAWEVIYDIHRK